MERMEALTNYYTTHDEDARLTPKRGMVEFLTTIHYVEKYLSPVCESLRSVRAPVDILTISHRMGMMWMPWN